MTVGYTQKRQTRQDIDRRVHRQRRDTKIGTEKNRGWAVKETVVICKDSRQTDREDTRRWIKKIHVDGYTGYFTSDVF